MKKSKGFSLLLCLMLTFGFVLPSNAESVNTEFIYKGIQTPVTVIHNLNNSYRHNGDGNKAVHYYGYTRSAESYSNDSFDSGYNYMSYGTGSKMYDYNLNHFCVSYDKDLTEMKVGDALYFSFYYRSHSTFTGVSDNRNYTGQETKPAVMLSGKTRIFNELSTGLSSVNDSAPNFKADNTWHKAEYYIPVNSDINSLTSLQFGLSFFEMDKAFSIDLSGFSYGLLSAGSDFDSSDDAYYTYISQLVNKPLMCSLFVEGKSVALKEGVYDYTAPASALNILVKALRTGNEKKPVVTKIDDITYEIKIFAVNYDEINSEEKTYTRKVDENKNYSSNGTVETYKVKNEDKFAVITLHLNVKPVSVTVKAGGSTVSLPYVCEDKKDVTINATFNNYYDESYTYITVLVVKDNDRILQIVPFKTELDKNIKGKTETFSHTVDLKGAENGTLDLFVLEKNSLYDVLK